jgi:hypothetical protein
MAENTQNTQNTCRIKSIKSINNSCKELYHMLKYNNLNLLTEKKIAEKIYLNSYISECNNFNPIKNKTIGEILNEYYKTAQFINLSNNFYIKLNRAISLHTYVVKNDLDNFLYYCNTQELNYLFENL